MCSFTGVTPMVQRRPHIPFERLQFADRGERERERECERERERER